MPSGSTWPHFGLPFILLSACIVPGCGTEADEAAVGEDDIATGGSWTLPADVREAGQQQRVRYDDAPPWRGRPGCGGGILTGTRELGDHLKQTFPTAIRSYGGYACRQNTANASQTSVHGTGRALDIFVPLDRGNADNGKGDPVANWLVRNAADIGVQLVIWDRTVWQANGRGAARYTGPNPHTDHIHVEINNDGAARKTNFFDGKQPDATEQRAPEEIVEVMWNALAGYRYSLDVRRKRDGKWVGPCLSAGTLGTSTSASYRGVCDGGRELVPKSQVSAFRVYYSNSATWTKFVEVAFDGKAERVNVELPEEKSESGGNEEPDGSKPAPAADAGTPAPSTGTTTPKSETSDERDAPPGPPPPEDEDGLERSSRDDERAEKEQTTDPKQHASTEGCSVVFGHASARYSPGIGILIALTALRRRRSRRSSFDA